MAEKTVGRKRSVLAVTIFLIYIKFTSCQQLHKKNERIHLISQIKWLKTEYRITKLANIREINSLRFRDYKKDAYRRRTLACVMQMTVKYYSC